MKYAIVGFEITKLGVNLNGASLWADNIELFTFCLPTKKGWKSKKPLYDENFQFVEQIANELGISNEMADYLIQKYQNVTVKVWSPIVDENFDYSLIIDQANQEKFNYEADFFGY